jgi:hypothetical protein
MIRDEGEAIGTVADAANEGDHHSQASFLFA